MTVRNIGDIPNYYKGLFPYSKVPKLVFDNVIMPMDIPEDIWITDTTFRDGQQSMSPFSIEQIVKIYDMLNKLDGGSGIIRQTEFFLYTEKDRKAIEKCMERGYKFPEITTWIRANKNDFKLVKDFEVKETGILMSCSDYHIYKKLKKDRKKAMEAYLEITEEAMINGIKPRCHLEDITRADFYGFVVPLVEGLLELSNKYKIPVKIRACDTLGLGISYSGVSLPRSVQALIHGLRDCGLPSEAIEWHGHNDFYAGVTNSTTAWLYGASSVNTTLLGIGERTGNTPLEAMLIEYCQLKGKPDGVNLQYITEIAEYFKEDMKYCIPEKTPYVGQEFNVTRAGIHADGILKDEEIYNIFDTEKLLGRPVVVAVNEYSGLAGIAAWINTYFRLQEHEKISKNDERVKYIKEWIDEEYEGGRTTIIGNNELQLLVEKYFKDFFRNIC